MTRQLLIKFIKVIIMTTLILTFLDKCHFQFSVAGAILPIYVPKSKGRI